MRTLEDALNQFAYHPATPAVGPRYAEMRAEVMSLTRRVWDKIPDGPEKTLAFRGLQQFLMNANLAIALTTPTDLETPHVARVLPDDLTPEQRAAGATWRCVGCGTPLNDNAVRHIPGDGRQGPLCEACI